VLLENFTLKIKNKLNIINIIMNLYLLLAIGIFALSYFLVRPFIFESTGLTSYYEKESLFLLLTFTIIIPIILITISSFIRESATSIRKSNPRLSRAVDALSIFNRIFGKDNYLF
jgi:hypothetical protein